MRIVVISLLSVAFVSSIAGQCQDPPELRQHIIKRRNVQYTQIRKKRQMLGDNHLGARPTIENTVEATTEAPLNSLAVCSWTYVENFNESRRPQLLQEVRCNPNTHCNVDHAPRIFAASHSCEMVYRKIDVIIIDGCENNINTWRIVQENIPVACVCARKRFFVSDFAL